MRTMKIEPEKRNGSGVGGCIAYEVDMPSDIRTLKVIVDSTDVYYV